MRQKRAKSYRKQMLVYQHTFKFREPYQVLVDDQIVLECSKSGASLGKALKSTLQAEVKVMISQCCMQALYTTNDQDAIQIAKEFERRRCNHPPKDPKMPMECIQSIVNVDGRNKHRYVVASQDIELRRKLRQVPGVPQLYISRTVMIMEPLSDASRKVNVQTENEKLVKGLNDPSYTGIKEPVGLDHEGKRDDAERKRKRTVKGPNPLSVKKKKKVADVTETSKLQNSKEEKSMADATSKRKRRRKHKPKESTGST